MGTSKPAKNGLTAADAWPVENLRLLSPLHWLRCQRAGFYALSGTAQSDTLGMFWGRRIERASGDLQLHCARSGDGMQCLIDRLSLFIHYGDKPLLNPACNSVI